MKSKIFFIIVVVIAALISLFIPYWFVPFIFSLIVGFLFDVSIPKTIWIHFLVYFLVCSLYCIYSILARSKELAGMIGQLFMGLSLTSLVIVSSLLFAITAMTGAWVGAKFRLKEYQSKL